MNTNSPVLKDLFANFVDTSNNHLEFVETQQNQLSKKKKLMMQKIKE